MSKTQIGKKYRHYKGNEYIVLGIAMHTETMEPLVIYQEVNGDKVWARPQKMFEETIEIAGKQVERFEEINETFTV